MTTPRYITCYEVTRLCYSPAEGGCYYDHHRFVGSMSIKDIPLGNEWWQNASEKTLEEAGERLFRDQCGAVFEDDTIEQWGKTRKVRGISSASPEAKHRIYLEEVLGENTTTKVPVYE